MKNFKLFILVLFLSVFSYGDEKLNTDFYFGISIDKLDKVQQTKIKSVGIRIKKEFEEFFNGKYKFHVDFIYDEKTLIDSFVNYKDFNMLMISSTSYLDNKDRIKSVGLNTFSFNSHDRFQKYILLANKKSNIKSIKDLKGKNYTGYIGNDNYSLWLDYLALKELKTPYKKLILSEKRVPKDSLLVLNVFFNKSDFTVLRKDVYEDMILLNPSLKKELFIVRESEAIFIYGLGLFHKKTPKVLIDTFNGSLNDGTFNKKFKDLFRLLNKTSLERVSFSELETLEEFYDDYINLKEKR